MVIRQRDLAFVVWVLPEELEGIHTKHGYTDNCRSPIQLDEANEIQQLDAEEIQQLDAEEIARLPRLSSMEASGSTQLVANARYVST
jgi:hypothetical protein